MRWLILLFMIWGFTTTIAKIISETPNNVLIGYALLVFVALPLLWKLIENGLNGLFRSFKSSPNYNYAPAPAPVAATRSDDATVSWRFARLQAIEQQITQGVTADRARALCAEAKAIAAELTAEIEGLARHAR